MLNGIVKRCAYSMLASSLLLGGAMAETKPLTKVRIAVGTSVLNISYPMLTLPGPLGYWKDEGLDVELLPVGASLQAVQQMVSGNAEFAVINASVAVQANAKNNLPVRVVMVNGPNDWTVVVDDFGSIKSIRDLKGKTIGVFSLATGGIVYFNSYLKANGLDPKDFDLVPLGLGAPPVQALRTGQVQGLLYWGAAIATFENAGLKLRKFAGDDWSSYPDYSVTTMQATVERDPAVVAGIARAISKATVFALANPDCSRQIHWKTYPSTKGSAPDEATLLKWEMNSQQAQLDALTAGFRLGGGKTWGAVDPAGFDRLSALMLEAKLIDKPVAGATLAVAPRLAETINDFDRATIEASAKACRF